MGGKPPGRPPIDGPESAATRVYLQFSRVPPFLQDRRTKFYICCRYVHGMPIPIAVPSPVSRAGGSLSPLSAPAGRTWFPGLALPEVESAGLAGSALPAAGNTVNGSLRTRRNPAEGGWAGVVDEYALKGRSPGFPPVR